MEKVTLDFLCSQLHVLTILYNFIHQCICWKSKLFLFKKKIARCFQTDPSTQPLILALLKVWSKQNRRQDSTMAVVRQLARACSCRGAERTTGTEILDATGRCGFAAVLATTRSSSCAHCWSMSIHAWLPFSIRRAKCPRNPRSLASLILNFLRSDDTD